MALLQISIAMAFTKSHLEKYNRYYNTRYHELFNHLKLIDIITPDIMSYLITLGSNRYYNTRYHELFNHLRLIDIITPDIMSYLITLNSHIFLLIFFRRYYVSLH